MAVFGENLRTARENAGYTQAELADKLFVTKKMVFGWECGTRYPDLIMVRKISEELGISEEELLPVEDKAKCQEKKAICGSCVMDNSKNLMIQSGIFAVTAVAYIFITLLYCNFFWEQWQTIKGELEIVQKFFMKIIGFYSIASILSQVAWSVGLLWGFISSIRKGLTLRQNRVVLSLLLIIRMVWSISKVIMGSDIFYVLPCLVGNLLLIVFICRFFSGKKSVSPMPVYVMCGLYAFDSIVSFVQELGNSGTPTNLLVIYIVTAVVEILLAALIVFQTYCVNKRRKNFDKI